MCGRNREAGRKCQEGNFMSRDGHRPEKMEVYRDFLFPGFVHGLSPFNKQHHGLLGLRSEGIQTC